MIVLLNGNRCISKGEISFLDTTLRDGEQAPGISLSVNDKVRIVNILEETGVDIIEAGSACTSENERKAISKISSLGLEPKITSFTRGVKGDIDLALDCNVDGINLVVPSSDKHIEKKVGVDRNNILETTIDLVEYAKDHGLWVEVLGEDGSRADPKFLKSLMKQSLEAGADRICYCDTVGYSGPEHTYKTISMLSDLGPTSTHTHDDLGLAMTNTLASIAAGADLVHATVNGIGERAGNVALEEVAVSIWHLYDVKSLELSKLYKLSKVVEETTGIVIPPNKAVVGENAFTHESGIHTDGTLKDEAMYEPYPPEIVGRERELTLGKHTGKSSVKAKLNNHDIDVSDKDLSKAVEHVKKLGQKGEEITDEDLISIIEKIK